MSMRLDRKAFFLSLWLETLLYGFHTVLFCVCIYLLVRRKRPGYVVFLVTASFIFIFSTLHVFFVLEKSFPHFTQKKAEGEESLHHRDHHQNHHGKVWPSVVTPKTFAYVMNGFFADALVVYRCHAIWNFNTPCVIPAILLVLVTAMVGVSDITDPDIQPGQAFFALSLATNLYATIMAVGRLYYMAPATRALFARQPHFLRRYTRAFIITLETGIINSACFVVFLILCRDTDTEGGALMMQDAFAQIMGIIPTMIIVIVGLGSDSYYTTQKPDRSQSIRPIRTISLA